MYSEETTIYQRKKNLRPRLFVIQGDMIREYSLEGRQTMGRQTSDNRPDIDIPVGIVSRRHGLFVTSGGVTVYQDIGSSNGTLAGNTVLHSGMKTTLMSGDVLRIRARNASGSDKDVVLVYSTEYPQKSAWRKISLTGDIRSLEIGRGEGYFLQDETVSRHHATFFLARNGWAIIDNKSKNGVFLNGRRVGEPELLHPMDVVQIANHLFIFRGDSLLIQADEPRIPAGGGGLRPAAEGSFFQEAGAMGSALSGPEALPHPGGMPGYPDRRDGRRPGRGPVRPEAGSRIPGGPAPLPGKAVRRPAGGGRARYQSADQQRIPGPDPGRIRRGKDDLHERRDGI